MHGLSASAQRSLCAAVLGPLGVLFAWLTARGGGLPEVVADTGVGGTVTTGEEGAVGGYEVERVDGRLADGQEDVSMVDMTEDDETNYISIGGGGFTESANSINEEWTMVMCMEADRSRAV